MALIKCPECQHDVSDSAIQCPNCGFSIKKYCDIKKLQNEARTEAYEYVKKIKREEEGRRLQAEIERKNEEEIKQRKNNGLKKKKEFLCKRVIPFCILLGTIVLVSALYTNIWLPYKKYNIASNYITNEQYSEAVNILEDIKEYKDSKEMLFKVYYRLGVEKYNNEDYQTAITFFQKSYGYADSTDMIKISQDEMKYLEANELMTKRLFEKAYEILRTLPDDMTNVQDFRIECCMKVAQQYLDKSKYSQCIGILEENGVNDGELYLEAQYLWAKNLIVSKNYSEAIEKFNKLGKYKDSQILIEACNNNIIYEQALKFMNEGNLNSAIEKLTMLDSSYNDKVDMFIKLCKQYKKYCAEWECTKYRINNLDGRGEHNLDYAASSENMISKVKINESGEIMILFNGCESEINGDVATWNQYESVTHTPNTFNLNTGVRVMKFYSRGVNAKETSIYTYSYKRK